MTVAVVELHIITYIHYQLLAIDLWIVAGHTAAQLETTFLSLCGISVRLFDSVLTNKKGAEVM